MNTTNITAADYLLMNTPYTQNYHPEEAREEVGPWGQPIQAGIPSLNLMEQFFIYEGMRPELSNLERLVVNHAVDLSANMRTYQDASNPLATIARSLAGQWFLAGAVLSSTESQIELGMTNKEIEKINQVRDLIWTKLNAHPALKPIANSEYSKLLTILNGVRGRPSEETEEPIF